MSRSWCASFTTATRWSGSNRGTGSSAGFGKRLAVELVLAILCGGIGGMIAAKELRPQRSLPEEIRLLSRLVSGAEDLSRVNLTRLAGAARKDQSTVRIIVAEQERAEPRA
jgi:hypothetical protein